MSEPLTPPYLKWSLWAVVGLIVLACIAAWFKLASLWAGGFQSSEMAAAQYSHKDVVGKLGGLPVRLPRYAVHLVEYDGEPSWETNTQPVVTLATLARTASARPEATARATVLAQAATLHFKSSASNPSTYHQAA